MKALSETFVKAWVVITCVSLAIALPSAVGTRAERFWPVFGIVIGSCFIAAIFVTVILRFINPQSRSIYAKYDVTAEQYHDIVYLARREQLPAGFSPEIVIGILEKDIQRSQISSTLTRVIIGLVLIFVITASILTKRFPYSFMPFVIIGIIQFVDFKYRILPKYERLKTTLQQRIEAAGS